MNRTKIVNWFQIDSSRKSVRQFGLILTLILAGYFSLRWWRGDLLIAGYGVAFLLGLCSVVYPSLVRIIYIPWMVVVRIIGFVMTHVLLAIIFYLIFTPVGFVMRLFGKDPLERTGKKDSYWKPRKTGTQTDFERMF